MKKVFFLVNSMAEFDFGDLVQKHLSGVCVDAGEKLPPDTEGYDLVIPWSYRRKIEDIRGRKNILVFHSANLPAGRGWAPIYNAIVRREKFFVISGVQINDEVDAGDIVVKARFSMRDDYTAETIRRWDREISIMLVRDILKRFDGREITGAKQSGETMFYGRRRPEDNEVSVDSKLADIVDHLRACEAAHPAFFFYNGIKYVMEIKPEQSPDFPADVEVVFFDSAQ